MVNPAEREFPSGAIQETPQLQRVCTSEGPNFLSHLTLPVDTPNCCSSTSNNVYSEYSGFLEELKQYTQLAKPDKWLPLISNLPVAELSSHAWTKRKIDYTLALEESDLGVALQEGLQDPVLIPAGSPLGQHKLYLNNTAKNLSKMTFLGKDIPIIDGVLGPDGKGLMQAEKKARNDN
uniref:Uncharacterized protein n=1 Tax=Coccidioides posadasii RMSCC 3488 TaxID=454284 RepID=A0A0J6IDF7_COCPO|nr:hypothetical protein CPAG_06076 [Coccidioides posadasii RMSCC 3488]